MSARRHAVFRCDASSRIGGGHLRRCLTFAEALAANDWRISFAVRGEALALVPARVPCAPRWIVLDSSGHDEAAQIGAVLDVDGVDLVVVDHYGHDRRFEAACRGFARRIAVIDDLADRPHDADLLLDQTFARNDRDYVGLVSRDCMILCGSRYALLRPPFAEMRETALSRRRSGVPVRRILIGMGATDGDDLTSTAVAAVTLACWRLGQPVAIDVVLGAGAPHTDTVRRRLTGLPAWSIHVDASGTAMARLMASADLAIGAAGTASWERCCLGLATIVLIAADNQAKIAAELAAVDACRIVGAAGAATPERIAAEIEDLCRNDAARLAMAEAAAAVCDGEGTRRVVEAIEAILARAPAETAPAQ